jgi:molybdopterin converting factor small subunit
VPTDDAVTDAGMPRAATAPTATLRYWAAARAATGVESDVVEGCATVGDAVAEAVRRHPGLAPVAAVSSQLLDGRPAGAGSPLPPGAVVEVLPPFAGG